VTTPFELRPRSFDTRVPLAETPHTSITDSDLWSGVDGCYYAGANATSLRERFSARNDATPVEEHYNIWQLMCRADVELPKSPGFMDAND
jgi:hypothetical protein